jgi:hypothetical protein
MEADEVMEVLTAAAEAAGLSGREIRLTLRSALAI